MLPISAATVSDDLHNSHYMHISWNLLRPCKIGGMTTETGGTPMETGGTTTGSSGKEWSEKEGLR